MFSPLVPRDVPAVLVFADRKGKKTIRCRRSFDHEHDWPSGFELIGVFQNLSPDRSPHLRTKSRKRDRHKIIGQPEGLVVRLFKESPKSKGQLILIKLSEWEPENRDRRDYQFKLKKIVEKAKELMELGIEKRAAFAAAKKCGCHVH